MTVSEFLKSAEFDLCISKITKYKKGFTFSIPYYKMTEGQKNGMHVVMREAVQRGLVESVSVSYDINLEITEEEYTRL